MTIELTENTVGIWFVTLPPTDGDFMAHVGKESDGRFTMTYRFRYYEDDKAHDSEDRKNWYKAVISEEATETEVIKAASDAAQKLGDLSGGEVTQLLKGTGTLEQFVEQFKELPFMHMKEVSKDEFEKYSAESS